MWIHISTAALNCVAMLAFVRFQDTGLLAAGGCFVFWSFAQLRAKYYAVRAYRLV